MNVKQAVELATENLSEISDSANLDARLLTCYACNIEQTQLITDPERLLNPEQEKTFNRSLDRRTKGEPLAYITGTKEFWSLDFLVNQQVLIPRPETELLVELTLEAISNIATPRVLELGTGSGAIAIAIAKERNDCLVTATDISKPALDVAKQNAEKNNAEITFIQSNWYENLSTDPTNNPTNNQTNNKYNVIVCNPPYIAKNDPCLNKHVALFEPQQALISADNGLKDIKAIIAGAHQYLSVEGHLIVEHGFQQALNIKDLFTSHNFKSISTRRDLSKNERCTYGLLP